MISRTSAYALEAVLLMAGREGHGPVRAAELAAELGLPGNYLSKILNALARDGILTSERGPTGGFRLASPPGELTIERVIARFENVGVSRKCFLGRGTCSDEQRCPMHDRWKTASAPMFEFFGQTTIAELVASGGPSRHSATRAGVEP